MGDGDGGFEEAVEFGFPGLHEGAVVVRGEAGDEVVAGGVKAGVGVGDVGEATGPFSESWMCRRQAVTLGRILIISTNQRSGSWRVIYQLAVPCLSGVRKTQSRSTPPEALMMR